MRLLSQKADQMVAATDGWDHSVRLTSRSDAGRDAVRNDLSDFRNALRGLKSAADNREKARLTTEYVSLRTSYRKLIEKVNLTK